MGAVPGDADVEIITLPADVEIITLPVEVEIIIHPAAAAAEMTGQTANTAVAMLQVLTQVMRPVSEMDSGQAIIIT